MTTEDRKALKSKIIDAIAKIEEELVRLEEATQPITPENSIGRISRMDAINNKGVAEVALRSSKRKLGSLKLALSKIDEPDFGNCDSCKNPIAPARLMFMPESTKCVRCAR